MKDLIIDCFAGGGGASVGIEMALGRPSTRVQRGSSPRTDRFDSGWCMVQNPELKGERRWSENWIMII